MGFFLRNPSRELSIRKHHLFGASYWFFLAQLLLIIHLTPSSNTPLVWTSLFLPRHGFSVKNRSNSRAKTLSLAHIHCLTILGASSVALLIQSSCAIFPSHTLLIKTVSISLEVTHKRLLVNIQERSWEHTLMCEHVSIHATSSVLTWVIKFFLIKPWSP